MKPKKIVFDLSSGITEEIELTDTEYQLFLQEQGETEISHIDAETL